MAKNSFCEECGAPLTAGSAFCEECGSPVQPAAKISPESRGSRSRAAEDIEEVPPSRTVEAAEEVPRRRIRGAMSEDMYEAPEGRGTQRERGVQRERGAQREHGTQRERGTGRSSSGSGRSGQNNVRRGGTAGRSQAPVRDSRGGMGPVQYFMIGIAIVLLIALIGFGVFWILGRNKSSGDSAQNGNAQYQQEEVQPQTQAQTQPQTQAQTQAQTQPQTQAQTQSETQPQTQPQEAADIELRYSDFIITLPGSWKGKYGITQGTSANCVYFTFYQQASKQLNGAGVLFSVAKYTDTSYTNLPRYELLGMGGGAAYVIEYPTDVQSATQSSEATAEYQSMYSDIDTIKLGFQLLVSGDGPKQPETQPQTQPQTQAQGGYISYSSDRYLTDQDVAGMSYDDLQMAINEIYARHHYLFETESILNYFKQQNWYDGYISKNNFNTNVFTDVEKANVDFLVAKMSQIGG